MIDCDKTVQLFVKVGALQAAGLQRHHLDVAQCLGRVPDFDRGCPLASSTGESESVVAKRPSERIGVTEQHRRRSPVTASQTSTLESERATASIESSAEMATE